MRRVPVLCLTALLLAGCAGQQSAGSAPGTSASPGGGAPPAAFTARAAAVAETWRTAPGRDAWRTGFVPLEDLTVPDRAVRFDDDTKMAFGNGWFRAAIDLPRDAPPAGTVRYDTASQQLPLISAADAYAAIDQGDPPPCARSGAKPVTPPQASSGPDGTVGSSQALGPCIPLTVTAAKLGTVQLRTSRGPAETPAWLFTIQELAAPIARVAVAPAAVTAPPSAQPPTQPAAPGLVSVQALTGVDGAKLSYQLGVGACDENITPLVHETADVVVVGGSVTTREGACTMQLMMAPVAVTLDAPLGARPVLDAQTGQPLMLRRS